MRIFAAALGAFASVAALADGGTVVSAVTNSVALDLRPDAVHAIASRDEVLPLLKFGSTLELSVRPMGSAEAADPSAWLPTGEWTVLSTASGEGTVVWKPTEGRLYETRLVTDGVTYSGYFNARSASDVTRLRDLSTLTVTLDGSAVYATGYAVTPSVTVRDGATILSEGTDYLVRGLNNINVGTGTALVLGIGAYDGGVSLPFAISSHPGSEVAYGGRSPVAVDLLTRDVRVIMTTNEILMVSICTTNAVSLAVTPATATDSSDVSTWTAAGATVTNGVYAAEQTVRWCPTARGLYVLTLADGAGELGRGYFDCTETAEFESATPIDDFDASLSSYAFPCDGYEHRPTVRVFDGDGNELVEGRDFSASYSSNVATGIGTVTVRGMGNYSGSIVKVFAITPVEPFASAAATAEPVLADTRTNAVLPVAWLYRDTSFARNNVADWPAGGLDSATVKARLSAAEVSFVGEKPDASAYQVFAESDGEGTGGWHPGKAGLFRVRLEIGTNGVYGAECGSRYLNFRQFGGLMLLIK